MTAVSIEDSANKKNLLLLVTLRWLAVAGQVATILIAHNGLGFTLPLLPMSTVLALLIVLNLVTFYRCRSRAVIADGELLAGLLLDVGALTLQLYLSGGATNPFVSLFLLQVILGAVLLKPAFTWTLVAVTSVGFLWLTRFYHPIDVSSYQGSYGAGAPSLFHLHIYGMFVCFLLASALIVLFVTGINANITDRDRRLSELQRQGVEEEHIVRMGLLASGAAHELGTPLATLSVILNDWRRMPVLLDDADLSAELLEMRGALARCKEIVSRVLLAAGEARSENSEPTTLLAFLDGVLGDWQATRGPKQLDYQARITGDLAIVADSAVRQSLLNVLDNALEASPDWVGVEASRIDDQLVVRVSDRGAGFRPDILANFGKPYQSTKERSGRGLGLFLVVNVLRKLGGTVTARNNPEGGALVELCLPIEAVAIGTPHAASEAGTADCRG